MGVAIKITVQLKKSNTSGKKSEKSSNIISFSFIEDTKEENRRVKLVKSSFCRSETRHSYIFRRQRQRETLFGVKLLFYDISESSSLPESRTTRKREKGKP